MHKLRTSSGRELWYDVNTNRISQWTQQMSHEAYPVVHFKESHECKMDQISMFTIEITQQCNLRCSYCCYSGAYRDRRKHNPQEISYEILDKTIEFILNHMDANSDEISVCFYGGEALIAKNKIQYLINKLDLTLGDRVTYSLSTNGYALSQPIVDWICEHEKFLVNITIDGNQTMHDAHRQTLDGRGSFQTIIKNLTYFKYSYPEQYDQRVRFLSTVYTLDEINSLSQVWDTIDVLKGKLPIHISQIIPNFDDSHRIYDSIATKDDFYSKAFEDYKSGIDSIRSLYFKKLIYLIEGRPLSSIPDELNIITCYQDLFSCFINVYGDIYACEKFCDEYSIGNVKTGFDKIKMINILHLFAERKNKYCQSCWAQRFCRMCLTGLNHTENEIERMCDMERDTIEIALKYFCEKTDWDQANKLSNH